MPFIPTPDCIKAQIFWTGPGGALAQNRMYFGATSPVTVEQLQEVTDALYDVIIAQLIPNTSNDWSLTGIRAVDAAEEEGLFFNDENDYPVVGGAADVGVPGNQVSYTVTLDSGLTGRSARGRVYGVGLPTSYVGGNILNNTGRSALQSVWTLIRTAMETAGHATQVVSFVDAGVPRTEGRALAVVAFNVRFPLATQRRRLS